MPTETESFVNFIGQDITIGTLVAAPKGNYGGGVGMVVGTVEKIKVYMAEDEGKMHMAKAGRPSSLTLKVISTFNAYKKTDEKMVLTKNAGAVIRVEKPENDDDFE